MLAMPMYVEYMVYETQNGPTLTTTIPAHSLTRGAQIVVPARRGRHHALIINRHPTHHPDEGVIRVQLTYPDGTKYGHATFATNQPIPYVIGGRTQG